MMVLRWSAGALLPWGARFAMGALRHVIVLSPANVLRPADPMLLVGGASLMAAR
ncbi:hypothetical protein ABZ403_26770 [Micromonospora zamorensis]|uniref:hypothetical protein n=1 Tax=Micromonospora zamorensis TaxID=709883 RepID=UPI0033FEF104